MTSHIPFDTEEPLWTWRADSGDGTRGAYGVTNMLAVARERLLDALRAMPGAGMGAIRQAQLDITLRPYPGYVHGVTVMTAERHLTGQIMIRGRLL